MSVAPGGPAAAGSVVPKAERATRAAARRISFHLRRAASKGSEAPRMVQSDNALKKVRFSATLGQEPQIELALV